MSKSNELSSTLAFFCNALSSTAAQAAPIPVQVGDYVRVRSVSCGAAHTGVVTDDGRYVWGCGGDGRLGLGASQMSSVLRPRRVRDEASGASFSLYPQIIDCAGFFPSTPIR